MTQESISGRKGRSLRIVLSVGAIAAASGPAM
jgi:hypothetical protein